MKLRVQGQEEDQRGPGESLSERTVKLINFLLVPAYPGSPGQKAVKRLCVCVCVCVCVVVV